MKFLLPCQQLFGRFPAGLSLAAAKDAGYDGAEIVLFRWTVRRLNEIRDAARQLGLMVHLHQAWSIREGKVHWYNWPLYWTGHLPHPDAKLSEQFLPATEPIVIYADRVPEYLGLSETRRPANYWFQTLCAQETPAGLSLPYRQFADLIREHKLNVVFDIQHALEYASGALNDVTALHGKSSPQLYRDLRSMWDEIGPFVKEIHVTDANPALGRTKGRNLMYGQGILPLREFCHYVRQSGWDGTVVPEIAPQHIPKTVAAYRDLLGKTRNLFK